MTFFKGMSDIEYESARSLIEMTSFAEKVADASVRDVDQSDYEQLKRTEEVLFMYFYDSKMAEEDFAPLDATLLPLISHASLLKTNDKALLKKYGITSCPSLLVIRNDRVSVYPATSPHAFKYSDQILQWMKTVWLPIVPEITASNAREVTAGKLVALAVLDPADAAFETYKSQLLTSATQWMDKEGDSIVAQSLPGTATKIRPVAFAWIDGMAWAKWLASAYNIDIQTTGPRYVINDQEVCFLSVINSISLTSLRLNNIGIKRSILLQSQTLKICIRLFKLSYLRPLASPPNHSAVSLARP